MQKFRFLRVLSPRSACLTPPCVLLQRISLKIEMISAHGSWLCLRLSRRTANVIILGGRPPPLSMTRGRRRPTPPCFLVATSHGRTLQTLVNPQERLSTCRVTAFLVRCVVTHAHGTEVPPLPPPPAPPSPRCLSAVPCRPVQSRAFPFHALPCPELVALSLAFIVQKLPSSPSRPRTCSLPCRAPCLPDGVGSPC